MDLGEWGVGRNSVNRNLGPIFLFDFCAHHRPILNRFGGVVQLGGRAIRICTDQTVFWAHVLPTGIRC